MWCKQYRENNDAEKLCSLGVNAKDPSNIMADIYGSQNRILLQNKLAGTENANDFKTRLHSLQPAWDNIVPGVHHWVKEWRSEIFIECLILSTKESHRNTEHRTPSTGKKMIAEDEVPK